MTLRDRVAIVTGGSRGIGRGIALDLAREGAHVVIAARDAEALARVAGEARQGGGRADAFACDLRLPESAERLVAFALEHAGRIDIVVNNAGATRRAEFLELSDHDWADGFALKFFGAVRLCRAAWTHLKANRGSVVNIAGIGGRTPGAAFAVGGSVNAALLSLTKALAETGLIDGVQVNAINPGSIRTDRLQKRLADLASKSGVDVSDVEGEFVRAERVTRIGETDDVAALVAFIVGPKGRFLHGATIDVDGGATKTL